VVEKTFLIMYENLLKEIPSDRKYSKVEALLFLQCDFYKNKEFNSLRYYERQFRWSLTKVRNFVNKVKKIQEPWVKPIIINIHLE